MQDAVQDYNQENAAKIALFQIKSVIYNTLHFIYRKIIETNVLLLLYKLFYSRNISDVFSDQTLLNLTGYIYQLRENNTT